MSNLEFNGYLNVQSINEEIYLVTCLIGIYLNRYMIIDKAEYLINFLIN